MSLGGDSDTLACIAGGMAQAYYGGVPDHIAQRAAQLLPEPLREIVAEFSRRYGSAGPEKNATT